MMPSSSNITLLGWVMRTVWPSTSTSSGSSFDFGDGFDFEDWLVGGATERLLSPGGQRVDGFLIDLVLGATAALEDGEAVVGAVEPIQFCVWNLVDGGGEFFRCAEGVAGAGDEE